MYRQFQVTTHHILHEYDTAVSILVSMLRAGNPTARGRGQLACLWNAAGQIACIPSEYEKQPAPGGAAGTGAGTTIRRAEARDQGRGRKRGRGALCCGHG